MSTRYIAAGLDGGIVIIQVVGEDPSGLKVTKALYELSRTTDMESRFDSVKHTRAVIQAGLEGHRPMALLGECDHADLPTDRKDRDHWEWSDDCVKVRATRY